MAMLRPTYIDLIDRVNEDVPAGEEPIIKSRYSIVLAAAKRARQIIAFEPDMIDTPDKKPLSVAVEELNSKTVKVLSDGE